MPGGPVESVCVLDVVDLPARVRLDRVLGQLLRTHIDAEGADGVPGRGLQDDGHGVVDVLGQLADVVADIEIIAAVRDHRA